MLTNTPTVPVAGELDENERIVMATHVAGDTYRDIDGKLFEIKRQLRQPNGYPFNPELLELSLQAIIEGKFPVKLQQKGAFTSTLFTQSSIFHVSATNLSAAIVLAEGFAKSFMGINVDLREQFDFPEKLPWPNVLVVFDPGLNLQETQDKVLKGQGISICQKIEVEKYCSPEVLSQSTLCIIENSTQPSEDTLGESAKQACFLGGDGRTYLDLRGYVLAFGLRYFISQDYFDKETWTVFPSNRRPNWGTAHARWDSRATSRCFELDWGRSDYVNHAYGARLAIHVPSKKA